MALSSSKLQKMQDRLLKSKKGKIMQIEITESQNQREIEVGRHLWRSNPKYELKLDQLAGLPASCPSWFSVYFKNDDVTTSLGCLF